MNNLLEYGIQSGISLFVLYLFYRLILHNDTHFRLNRFVLMFSLVISFLIPVISSQIEKTRTIKDQIPSLRIHFGPIETIDPQIAEPLINGNMPSSFNLIHFIAIIYLTGAFVIFARLIYQAIFLHAVERLSVKQTKDGYTIVSMSTDMVPFSYFKKIFIPAASLEESALDNVIAHEKTHLMQAHYLDLFVIEIMTILHWFNPVIWLFEKSIKEVHEYLADDEVLKTEKNRAKYQALLVNQALGGPVFIFTNQFNQSLIKKRIMMMKNKKTLRVAKLKALLIVPLVACLLLLFANPPMISQTNGNQLTIKGNVSDRFANAPVAGANLVIKGTNIGTITDLQGNYEIIVNSVNDVLVISFTGYRTQEIPVGRNSQINVLLEQDIMTIDFSGENQFVQKEPAAPEKQKNDENQNNSGQFVFMEELPAYPGGKLALQQFILKNVKYPDEAKRKRLEGTVMVSYIIDVNGQVKSPKIIRGLDPAMDSEALRVTKLIKSWKPATQGGRPISTMVTMPVEFKLSN